MDFIINNYIAILIIGVIVIAWGVLGLRFCNNYIHFNEVKDIKDPRKKVLVVLANGPIIWIFELYNQYQLLTTNNIDGTPIERRRRKLRAWGGLDKDAER